MFPIALIALPFLLVIYAPFWMSYYVSFDPVHIDIPKTLTAEWEKSQYLPLGVW